MAESLARVKANLEEIVSATKRHADAKVAHALKEAARSDAARKEAEAVLAEATQALSLLRDDQERLLSEAGELRATLEQMRVELATRDDRLSQLDPGHVRAYWAVPRPLAGAERAGEELLAARASLREKDAQLDDALRLVKQLAAGAQQAAAARGSRGVKRPVCAACGFGGEAPTATEAAEAAAAAAAAAAAVAEDESDDAPLNGAEEGATHTSSSEPMFWVTSSSGLLSSLLFGT